MYLTQLSLEFFGLNSLWIDGGAILLFEQTSSELLIAAENVVGVMGRPSKELVRLF